MSVVSFDDSIAIKNTIPDLYLALSRVLEELQVLGVDGPTQHAVHVTLDEALNNAYKHGNRCLPNKKIRITRRISSNCLQIQVEDEGDGFDPSSVGDPRTPENLCRGSGRGLFLMREFASALIFNKRGNQVTIVIRLPRAVQLPPSA